MRPSFPVESKVDDQASSSRLRIAGWVLAGIVVGALGYHLLEHLPQEAASQIHGDPPKRLEAFNSARVTGAQIFLGIGIFAGLVLTYRRMRAVESQAATAIRQAKSAEDGQITERFTRAIDQLGTTGGDKVAIRLGGIYALERILRDSDADALTVQEVLAAFVREVLDRRQEEWDEQAGPIYLAGLLATDTDLKAALSVLGRNPLPRHRPDLREVKLADRYLRGLELNSLDLLGANLTCTDLNNAKLTNTNLANANLRGADLTDADLTGASLTSANLTSADLTGANLTGANLTGADITGADLTGADLTGANLADIDFTDTDLFDTDFTGADLTGADLTGANLTGASLTGAHLQRANLTEAKLIDANLADADLTRANLPGIHLAGANLAGANLARAHLRRADLTGANLTGANLTGANLPDADLTDANLSDANLTDANLSGAHLTHTNLAGAYLNHANLTGTEFPDENRSSSFSDPAPGSDAG